MLLSMADIPREAASAAKPKADNIVVADYTDRDERIVLTLLTPDGLGLLRAGEDKHFYSRGAFNLVQLVFYILKQTGPANVFLSTYSIAEDSLQSLRRRLDHGDILSLRMLIDNRVRTISPKPFAYLVGAFGDCYRCCALHAKVALIWNADWNITVITSMNATHNPKLERGIVYTSRYVFDFDLKMLQDEFQRGTT